MIIEFMVNDESSWSCDNSISSPIKAVNKARIPSEREVLR